MSKPVISNTFSLTAIKQGDDGTPGGNTATLFLFKRSATPITAIDWNYALTYNFASQSLSSTPSGWTLNKVPAGTDPVYVTAATAYSTATSDTIAASEWSTPVLYTENTNAATIFLFKRSATAITAHGITSDNVYYKFADGKLYNGTGSSASVISDLNGWTRNIPTDDGKPCYVIQATAVGTGTHDQILHTEWSDVTKLVEDGKGISSADVLFCLANSQTTAPGDSSFTATSFAGLNIKNTDADKYVWQCIKTTYTSGNPTYGGKVCLGKVSDFASVVEQYALGTASAATGTWQNDTPPSAEKGKYLWTRTKLTYSDNSVSYSPSEAGQCLGYYGNDGNNGYSIALTLIRNNLYTDANWNTYAELGHSENYSKRTGDSDFTACRVGDYFLVSGTSSDSGISHTAIYKCTSVSANSITGTCVSHTHDGEEGDDGNGISSDNFYYCQTPTIEPPQTTYLTETYGWYLRGSSNCPTAPTGKNNYLWECRYIQYDKDTSMNKKILRLVLMRDTEVKPNLLEQTAFDSEDSMDKWMHNLGSIENVGEVIPQARGALNAFGAFPTSASEKNFLQQVVFNPGVLAKIKSNEWYTLSFYARTRRYVDMDGNTYGFYFQNIYLKAGTYKLQYNGRCSVSAYNNNVSLNGYLWYSGDHGQTEDWGKSTNTSLLSKADTTVTTGNFTVSTAGYYKIGFYAYKTSGHAGTENDIVHINWWRILSVGDNSQIYTFLYPSAVKNGSTYFVDGVVKSGLGTDANVCWQLDEDDDDCDNLGWTRHSVTFQTKSSITMAEQNVLFRMYNTYVEICMVKLEQNAMPTEWCENEHDTSTECSHNPCGTWVSGNTYYYCNGVRDVVRALDSANGGYNWFRMKRRTTFLGYKSTIQPYADTDHWEKGNKMKFTIVDSMFAEEIFTDKLTVARLLTTPDDRGAHVEMHDAVLDIFGTHAFPNIRLGIDDDGCAVLKFFNKDGRLMYDLGPAGISQTVSQDEVSRFLDRYQLVGANDNSDIDIDDAYSYYNKIFNKNTAGQPTAMYFYEAKITANVFDAGQYCASADDAQAANKRMFLEPASTTPSGRKYIRDIAKFTGLVRFSRFGNGQPMGGLYMTNRSGTLCDQPVYEGRAVPDDYDTSLDGSSLEVNFYTDDEGYYIDPIYYCWVIHFVNGEQVEGKFFYYNKSKVDLIG